MFHFPFKCIWPIGQLVLSIAFSLSMSVCLTQAGPWETPAGGTRSVSHTFPRELIELNSVFADDNSCVVTPCRCNSNKSAELSAATATELPEVTRGETALHRRNGLEIRLVALETLSESSSAGSIASTEIPPSFVAPQQPVIHEAITGPSTTQGTWVVFAPYGWISGINGQIVTPGRVLNINVSPSDVLEHLGDVNGAFMLHTEFGRGDWGIIIDGSLIRLSPQVTTGPALIDLDVQQTLMELLGMYRLVEASDYVVDGKSLTVDLLGGGRYYQVSNGLTIDPFGPGPTLQEQRSKTWVDLVLGARARAPLTSSLDVFTRADIGGFGIGSSSNFSWNVVAGLDYQWSSSTSLLAGYRVLDIDQLSGAGDTAFGFDVRMSGPFAAMAVRF
jgi:hypothetical protein